jgi:hypothetical protein
MTPEERQKHALRWANKIRKRYGLNATSRLTKGVPGHPHACCVAMTLAKTPVNGVMPAPDNVSVHLVLAAKGDEGAGAHCFLRVLDPELNQFLRDFDAGKYPALEVPKSQIKLKGQVIG